MLARRVLGILAALAATLGLVAVASPAQALSRSTWCSTWKAAGTVSGVGTLTERTCVQSLSTRQVRAVAELRIAPVVVDPSVTATPSASPSVTPSVTPTVRDGVIIRNIHQTPGDGLSTTFCRYSPDAYSELDDPLVLSCFSAYVPLERGVARVRTWATVTDGGLVKGTPLTGYFTHMFA